ncbi:zinc finger protein [Biomphalaria pfeifferi]|uniref:Zinc finger protein n=1 Tax=Biomphalaria pfeifferi TaxID=112525 RepID=A0AAD8AUC2_BIOPF|nr:zinc finger protein [Biomphalaria pfeifferi]
MLLTSILVSQSETLLPRMRPSPTSLYDLIIQAPLMSHFIASYTRAGVFGCPKADLSSSSHIPVEEPFDETKEIIETFLERFQNLATNNQLPIGKWSFRVLQALRGKVYEVYAKLPSSTGNRSLKHLIKPHGKESRQSPQPPKRC